MEEESKKAIISVITPFYNTEKYFKECLDSILNQTFKDIELICINDKSTDKSLDILERYAKKDSRIKIINLEEKSGQATARNKGLEFINGDYIAFIDSDDIIDLDTFEKTYNFIKKHDQDMVVFNMVRLYGKKIIPSEIHLKGVPGEEIISTNILEYNDFIYDTCVCNKLVKTSFFKENNFKFLDGRLYEDMLLSMELFSKAKSVGVLPDVTYYWRIRRDDNKSTTQKRTERKNIEDRFFINSKIINLFNTSQEYEKVLNTLYYKILDFDYMLYLKKIGPENHELMEVIENKIKPFVKDLNSKYIDSLDTDKRFIYNLLIDGKSEDFFDMMVKMNECENKMKYLEPLKEPKSWIKYQIKKIFFKDRINF